MLVEDGTVLGIDEERPAENLQKEQEKTWDMLSSHYIFGRTIDELAIHHPGNVEKPRTVP